jgi:hypothetical protein
MLRSSVLIVVLIVASVMLIRFGGTRLARIRKNPSGTNGIAAARVALVLGYLCILVMAWWLVSMFQGLYRLGQLDSAIGRVHHLVAAETRFAQSHPERGYTCDLAELVSAAWSNDRSKMSLIESGRLQGYSFEIGGCQAGAVGKPNSTYQIVARPMHSGDKVCADQSGVVRFYDARCDQR